MARPLVVGIVNVPPDSFSDGGAAFALDDAVERGLALAGEGAHIIDVGGESTRHGATPVPWQEEVERVRPVVAALAAEGITVSIDSRNAPVMKSALEAGADIINDVSALTHDADALKVAADGAAAIILMHMKGTPKTMAGRAEYEDVVAEVSTYLKGRINTCLAAGIGPGRIAIDPGFGFAKRMSHNYELLERIGELASLGPPVCAGLSRKFGKSPDPKDRLDYSLNLARRAVAGGARILRVHDVAATVAALSVPDTDA